MRLVLFIGLIALAAGSVLLAQDPELPSSLIPTERDGWHRERHEKINEEIRVRTGAIDMVFVGDSITQSWEGPGKAVWDEFYGSRRVANLGISGDRTEHVLWRLDHGSLTGITPKVAVVLIGTNNVGHGTSTAEEVLAGVRAVVQRIRTLSPTTRVLLLDIFPRGETMNPMRGDIAQVNQALKKLQDGEWITHLAVGDHFIDAEGRISGEIMPDFLHLSAAGYRIWAEAMEPTIAAMLDGDGISFLPSQVLSQERAQVYLLIGQSNMEGKGAANTLGYLGEDPKYGYLLREVLDDQGYTTRSDVLIDFLGRRGPLSVGFGSQDGSTGPLIGPELGFGIAIGNASDAPVVLVKAAWGGKDLAKDFLPPSLGGPGPFYTRTVAHVNKLLEEIDERFMGGHDIAGIVWFQGWNDMIDEAKTAAYPERLAALIDDLRKEFNAPDLPVVIGELGVGGANPDPSIVRFREAQAAVPAMERFRGTVRLARTAPFWDTKAQKLYDDGVWKGPDKQQFYRIASDRPYHYLGSGKIFFLMGYHFGEVMLELRQGEQ